jgi:hypothetical protein
MKVKFVPIGRNRREWMWKARDANTITISGQRFVSLGTPCATPGSRSTGSGTPTPTTTGRAPREPRSSRARPFFQFGAPFFQPRVPCYALALLCYDEPHPR